MDEIGAAPPQRIVNFRILYMITQMVGISIVVLTIALVFGDLGGVAWTMHPKLEFNWHPLLMVFGMIFLYGNSILVYRGFRHARKKNLKWAHAGIHIAAFVFAVIGLVAVFDSHNLDTPPKPNLYSLHSWVGLGAVILFAAQYLFGFISFLYPGLSQGIKETVLPVHVLFGLMGFVFSAASALLGLAELMIFRVPNFSELPQQAVTLNFIGILIVIFSSLVVYLSTENRYKRIPTAEDTILLTGQTD